MIHLNRLQELHDEAERSARRLLICTIAANILFFGLLLGVVIGGLP